jgi:hypothetical protein
MYVYMIVPDCTLILPFAAKQVSVYVYLYVSVCVYMYIFMYVHIFYVHFVHA